MQGCLAEADASGLVTDLADSPCNLVVGEVTLHLGEDILRHQMLQCQLCICPLDVICCQTTCSVVEAERVWAAPCEHNEIRSANRNEGTLLRLAVVTSPAHQGRVGVL